LPLWRDIPAGAVETVVEVIATIRAHADQITTTTAADQEDSACVPS
jgi:hypothetical protein